MNITDALAAMEADPDTIATFTGDDLLVYFGSRRRVREALKAAEMNGANVAWDEAGWFNSVFSFRMSGTGRQLLQPLKQLVKLVGGLL